MSPQFFERYEKRRVSTQLPTRPGVAEDALALTSERAIEWLRLHDLTAEEVSETAIQFTPVNGRWLAELEVKQHVRDDADGPVLTGAAPHMVTITTRIPLRRFPDLLPVDDPEVKTSADRFQMESAVSRAEAELQASEHMREVHGVGEDDE